MAEQEGVAWVAGLFEGEGSVIFEQQARGSGHQRRLDITSTDRDVLVRVQGILGYGAIGTDPRPEKPHYKLRMVWYVCSWFEIEATASGIYPFLGNRRRASLNRMFDQPPKRALLKTAAGNRFVRVTAVRDPRAMAESPTDDAWWAWAAGLFEGEGSAICRPTSRRRLNQWQRRLQVHMADRDVLERFASVVGAGKVRPTKARGLTRTGNSHKPMFIWTCSKWADVKRICERFRPFLCARRTTQVEFLLAHPAGPIGGTPRAHCRRGHPLQGPDADVYVYGGRPQCRRCKALRYEALKTAEPPAKSAESKGRQKTHCVRGHPLSGPDANVYVWRGFRQCRPCAVVARHERRVNGPKRTRRRRSATP